MAKLKICIDAGHYGKYNQSPANKKYYESIMTWKLHLLQKKYLEEYGFEVILTRDEQTKDLTLSKRGKASKGCVLFISDHSNAVGSGVNEKIDYPVVYVPLSGKGDILGKKLADCIANVMDTNQNGRIAKRKSEKDGGEYYGVIRGAVEVGTVGMILEHSFHTNTRSTNWLLDDKNLDKLARAEADVIAAHYGMKKVTASAPVTEKKDTTVEIPKAPFSVKVLIDDLYYRSMPSMDGEALKYTGKGIFTISMVSNKWGKLKSGVGWIYLGNPEYCTIIGTVPFKVKVDIDDLNIRTGPGTNYTKTGEKTRKGEFTITEIKEGTGSNTGWGKLKSGAGWISLDYTTRV